jgi:hypothetical protein
LDQSAHKVSKERKVRQDQLALQVIQDPSVKQALQVLQEVKATQAQQSLERQDPQVLLAQQVLLAAQGLLDQQDQLE